MLELNTRKKDISVVFLMWIPYGFDYFCRFMESYLKFHAGVEHELVIFFNGAEKKENIAQYEQWMEINNINFSSRCILEKRQDLDVYFYAASLLSRKYICFLNTASVIFTDKWLLKLCSGINQPNAGIAAATGSMESHLNWTLLGENWQWKQNISPVSNLRNWAYWTKMLLFWSFYTKPFPNPHLRTNAFIIERSLFLSLHRGKLDNKKDAYRLESGNQSISRQILQKGFDLLIVGKDGKAYRMEEWNAANVYRASIQENLLIGDNQTRTFEEADGKRKKFLSKMAWGKDSHKQTGNE